MFVADFVLSQVRKSVTEVVARAVTNTVSDFVTDVIKRKVTMPVWRVLSSPVTKAVSKRVTGPVAPRTVVFGGEYFCKMRIVGLLSAGLYFGPLWSLTRPEALAACWLLTSYRRPPSANRGKRLRVLEFGPSTPSFLCLSVVYSSFLAHADRLPLAAIRLAICD